VLRNLSDKMYFLGDQKSLQGIISSVKNNIKGSRAKDSRFKELSLFVIRLDSESSVFELDFRWKFIPIEFKVGMTASELT